MNANEVIHKINTNPEWYPKSYSGYLLGIDMQAMGLSMGAKKIPIAQRYGIVYLNHDKKDHWDWFWDYNEMESRRQQILAKAKKDKNFAGRFFNSWKKSYGLYVNYFEYLAKSHPENFTNKQALKHFKKLYELCVNQTSFGYVVDSFLTHSEEDWLVKIIKQELGLQATTDVINTLTAPIFSSFVNNYELEILKLALLMRQNKTPQVDKQAKYVEQKFFWFRTNYLIYARLTAEEIKAEAHKFAKNKNLIKQIKYKQTLTKLRQFQKTKLIKKLKISTGLQNILKISGLFSKIQDCRKECVLRNNILFYEAAERLTIKNHLDKKLCFYINHDEFFKLLKGKKIDWKKVENRYNQGSLILYHAGISTELDYKKIKTKIKTGHLYPDLGNITVLKGSPAFAGLVKGKVRVLHNVKEIAAFPKGYILVANQTTPEYVPAMKKATGIITDQGGITSHAAIISRELKIPCVVGVKNATKLLKNDELIELNASQGIVKKIK